MSSRISEIEAPLYLIGAGVVLIYSSYKKLKRKTQIKNMVRQVISSASAGSVEIEGVAWPLRAIDTSMDGTQIVFRKIIIQKIVKRNKNSKWETVWYKSDQQPFFVFDHTGFLKILPESLEENSAPIEGLRQKIYSPENLKAKELESFDSFYDHSLSGFTASTAQGFFSSFFSFRSQHRIIENYIAIGSPVLIHGHLKPQDSFLYANINDDFKIFRTRVEKLLKNSDFRKQMFDKNRDGTVDARELYQGFRSTLKASVKNEITHIDVRPNGIPNEKIYGEVSNHLSQELQFADCFEEQLLASQPLYLNWLGIYGGAGMVAIGIYFLIMFIS